VTPTCRCRDEVPSAATGKVDGPLPGHGRSILDRSPLLDIKPYVPEFDSFPESRAGRLDGGLPGPTTADDRFAGDEGR